MAFYLLIKIGQVKRDRRTQQFLRKICTGGGQQYVAIHTCQTIGEGHRGVS